MKPDDSFWISGPGFVAWLQGQGLLGADVLAHRFGPTYSRLTLKWREGSNIQIWTVDKLLTQLDRHISELPDNLYINPPPRPRPPRKGELTPEEKVRIDRALGKEVPVRAIAKIVGRSETTVRKYVKKKESHEPA